MLNLSQSYVLGVDVAKEDLVVFDGEKHYKVKNAKGLRKLETIIRKHVGDDFEKVIISYEPTGGYSNHLVRFCSEKEIKTLKVNPYRASHFFKSQRVRAKNDDQDAENLRKLVFVVPEEVKETIIDERVERLKSLISVYEKVSKSIVRWKNSLAHRKKYYKTENREEIEATKSIIRVLQKKEKVIVKKINELIKENPTSEVGKRTNIDHLI